MITFVFKSDWCNRPIAEQFFGCAAVDRLLRTLCRGWQRTRWIDDPQRRGAIGDDNVARGPGSPAKTRRMSAALCAASSISKSFNSSTAVKPKSAAVQRCSRTVFPATSVTAVSPAIVISPNPPSP